MDQAHVKRHASHARRLRVRVFFVGFLMLLLGIDAAAFSVGLSRSGADGFSPSAYADVFCGVEPPMSRPAVAVPVVLPPHVAAMTVPVSIANFAFDPSDLTINVGDTVTWTNNDFATHTTSSNDGVWNSGSLAPTHSFSFTFTFAGTFLYHCNIHSFMTGIITVVDGSTPTPTTTPTNTATNTPTSSPTATNTPIQTPTGGTTTPTATSTSTSTSTPTNTPTATPTAGPAVAVSLPALFAAPQVGVTVPITTSDLTGRGVLSYDLQITFDPAIVQVASPAFDATGTLSSSMSITPNANKAGHLLLSAFQAAELAGSGTLINLKFTVVGIPGQSSALTFENYVDPDNHFHPGFRFNEGLPPSITTNGSITIANRAAFDYDGDLKTDISVFRPSTGAWYLQQSQAGLYGTLFGFGTDKIAPADYDGDGRTDIAVYRPDTGIWYVFNSGDGTVSYYQFGIFEDLPTPADYDGDGKADISVFRPSTGTWYRQNSSDGSFHGIQFGASEDKPTVGDFDGDGKADIAVFRPSSGAWYRINSSDGSLFGELFGFGSDILIPADYDGDGKMDLAVFRPSSGVWYVKNSSDSSYTYNVFGLADDIPAPGDFDGDGKADLSVFRPSDGNWYRQNSSDGTFTAFPFGQNGDKPTQTAFRY